MSIRKPNVTRIERIQIAVHRMGRRIDELTAAVMSASSGPKDYQKNEVFALFYKLRNVDRIAMLRGRGPTFYLFRSVHQWVDNSGRQVVIDAAA